MRYNTKRRNTVSKRKQGKKGYNKKKSVKKMKLKRYMRGGGGKAPKDCDNYRGIPLHLDCYDKKRDNFTISDGAKVITANRGKPYKLKFNFKGHLEIKDKPLLIKENAFSNQETLTSLKLPTSLIKIGEEAFKNCTMLEKITFTDSDNSSLKEIGNYAFGYCTALQSINLPISVRKIGDGAFYNCNNLTGEIKIPAGVLEIGKDTFNFCKSIVSIELPISVRKIGKSAFHECAGLTKFNFSIDEDSNTSKKKTSRLTEIGESAFSGCSTLAEFQIPNKVLNIGTTAFMTSGITLLHIPASLLEIGAHAFLNCPNLIEITVSKNSKLCSIGTGAFERCTSLETVDLSNSELLYLDDHVFGGCTKLTTITLHSRLKGVHKHAFTDCKGITVKEKPVSIDLTLFGKNATAV